MAKMTWTTEQQQVIDTRGRNLLVSAAAGSGKTAVLVERIIQMVTDPEHPVDIDRLLVMTFTNAAAAEMRERIADALEKRLEECPGDRNLERQTTLIHHAQITTIDSFCLRLLREHFQELDIDPGFRIGDEGELLLLKSDVMKELLEDYYGRNDPRFFRFVDMYASGKTDSGLEDYIMQVYTFSQSNPWPEEWIAACREEEDCEAVDDTAWMKFLIEDVRRQAEEFTEQLGEAIEIAGLEDGPQAYLPVLSEDQRVMRKLCEAEKYADVYHVLSGPLFGRLAAVRGKNVDPAKKELAAGIRNRVKDAVKKMRELCCPAEPENMFADMEATKEPILMLLELAEAFAERYQRAKAEKNLVDFNDLEHFALQILMKKEEQDTEEATLENCGVENPKNQSGKTIHVPGAVADELANYYEEILVDEYQDSNEVQETLIRAVSRERFGTPNVFMVGDVKQSIYKFRLAKPELFLEKYETYSKEDSLYQKIELHKNFRSRAGVLSSINDVFYSIMTKSLGNIAYTSDAALNPGAAYPEPVREMDAKTEVYLLNTGAELFEAMDAELADYTAKEAEARLIAAKIRELTDPEHGMKIWNGKTGQYEPLRKKDIVILLRSLSGWTEEFLSVLSAEGIPAFAESRTGYFTAVEVETVLNMLAVIDNPMQDIPLVSVLKSPMVGMTDRELAIVMAAFKRCADRGQDIGFYGAVRLYLQREECEKTNDGFEDIDWEIWVKTDDVILQKLRKFWDLLTDLRHEAGYLPVHRLIYRIFERTGYYDYVAAMPAGKVRQANLNMLVEKASAYERTSYQSLFDFIRYIEKLKKYDTDFGEAARVGENEDTVRIMSIHKSKGLEFPVVFLAGAGKGFNRQDSRGKILIDEKLGIATDFFEPELKVKSSTLKKNVLGRRSVLESMGEELRILYVAMTRAKEKLIITAGDKYLENRLEKYESMPDSALVGDGLPFTYLSAANSYLEWILMAARKTPGTMEISQVPIMELVAAETKRREEKAGTYAMLEFLREYEGDSGSSFGTDLEFDFGAESEDNAESRSVAESDSKRIGYDFGAMLHYQYPYAADITLHAKMSVSELKHQGQFEDDAESDFLPTIPAFMSQKQSVDEIEDETFEPSDLPTFHGTENAGTYRGTAYHRVLELIDFKSIHSFEDIQTELTRIKEAEMMDPRAFQLVRPKQIWKFFQSDIAMRMRAADEQKQLHKESQFVMGVPASMMDEADSDEPVLIQGIIDAWFEEDGEVTIVDYKTDRVAEGEEHVLVERYQIQMLYYAQALQQITQKKVKEAVIYSLTLQKEIRVPILL